MTDLTFSISPQNSLKMKIWQTKDVSSPISYSRRFTAHWNSSSCMRKRLLSIRKAMHEYVGMHKASKADVAGISAGAS